MDFHKALERFQEWSLRHRGGRSEVPISDILILFDEKIDSAKQLAILGVSDHRSDGVPEGVTQRRNQLLELLAEMTFLIHDVLFRLSFSQTVLQEVMGRIAKGKYMKKWAQRDMP